MPRTNYLLSLTHHSSEQALALLNIGGAVNLLGGRGGDAGQKDLRVIYQSKRIW